MNNPKPIRTIIFVSTGNAVRSPMARSFVNALFPGQYRAASAGTEPVDPDPLAVEVMREAGVDISGRPPLRAGDISDVPADYLVTLCDRAKTVCPLFANCRMSFHKGFPEPESLPLGQEARLAAYRKLRDDIRAWLEKEFA
ncbi:MAG: arsenate reductase ArsC [Thermodesulfobacteriota bacterium]